MPDPENLQQLLVRLAAGRNPAELSREVKRLGIDGLSYQTLYRLMSPKGEPVITSPTATVLIGFSQLFRVTINELWEAVAVSMGLPLEMGGSLLARSLPPRSNLLDDHPVLVDAYRIQIQATISAIAQVTERPLSSVRD